MPPMGILTGQIKSARNAYRAINGAAAMPPARPPAPTAPRPAAPVGGDEPPPARFSSAQVRSMDDRLGMAGPRVIRGGRGNRGGARYAEGEFKGMTEGQAVAALAREAESGVSPASPNSRGGRSAPLSRANGTMGTGGWALDEIKARQGRSLAADRGLVPPGQTVPPSQAMVPGARQSAVAEFRNHPTVKGLARYEATQPIARNVPDAAPPVSQAGFSRPLPVVSAPGAGGKGVASRVFGAQPGQSPGYASPGAPAPAPADPVADFRRSLSALAAPGAQPAAPTPAAPAVATRTPAAGASPDKKRPA